MSELELNELAIVPEAPLGSDLPDSAVRVLLTLYSMAGLGTSKLTASHEEIALRCAKSAKSVASAIRVLTDARWLAATKSGRTAFEITLTYSMPLLNIDEARR